MATPSKAPTGPTADAVLLELARRLSDAAVAAGRPDVAVKADEAMTLIAGAAEPAGDHPSTVLRILDGLGF